MCYIFFTAKYRRNEVKRTLRIPLDEDYDIDETDNADVVAAAAADDDDGGESVLFKFNNIKQQQKQQQMRKKHREKSNDARTIKSSASSLSSSLFFLNKFADAEHEEEGDDEKLTTNAFKSVKIYLRNGNKLRLFEDVDGSSNSSSSTRELKQELKSYLSKQFYSREELGRYQLGLSTSTLHWLLDSFAQLAQSKSTFAFHRRAEFIFNKLTTTT